MKWLVTLWIFIGLTFWNATSVEAQEKYGIWVNPIRAQERWRELDIKHLEDQIKIGERENVKGTWLVQYGALINDEITKRLVTRTGDEVGAWLEVDEKLAKTAEVYYDSQRPWYDPGVVFLSGYERGERARMIDKYYGEFKARLGYWPKSVGAWWIDSWSLNYIKANYGLEAILIVADQKGTDGYGVWGQWTGVPYWPSNTNVLVPAKSLRDNLGAVVIQWAQRDPELGYLGKGIEWSNNSVQANDYTTLGKDFGYFKKLANNYIGAGQITLGLEVGQEALGNLGELEKQIEYVKSQGAKFVTMSQFSEELRKKSGGVNQEINMGGWKLTTGFRENAKLNQKVSYQDIRAFGDYFKADKSSFLDRNLENLKPTKSSYLPWWVVVATITIMAGLISKKGWAVGGILWALNVWGLIFISTEALGWKIYYSTVLGNLALVQIILVGAGIIVGAAFKKNITTLVGIFGLIPIISSIRYSVIGGVKFVGLMAGGQWLGWPQKDFSALETNSMIKFPWDKIWSNAGLSMVAYPAILILAGLIMRWILGKTSKKIKTVVLIILWGLMALNLYLIGQAAPRLVTQ
jgi:hypothetical protein